MFSIRVLPESERGIEGERLGEIIIDDFRERFVCVPGDESVKQMENRWRQQLTRLVEGNKIAVLSHDPRMAWVVYREGDQCFVRQVLSLDGTFVDHTVRQMNSGAGQQISEWQTHVRNIQKFIGA